LENYRSGNRRSPPASAGTFCPSPILVFDILHAGNVFLLQEQDILPSNAGRFRKSIKIKITGKSAGDLPHGEGRSRT
jgi:hypothetical protein